MTSIKVEDSENPEVEQTPEATVIQDAPSQPEPVFEQQPKKSSSNSKILVSIGIVLVVLLTAGLVWLQNDRKQLKEEVTKLSQTQKVDAVDEATELSQKVGQLIQLPTDEVPTVATVVDAEKVRSQAFFANAQNGDKVLLYTKSSKAILYRPSTNKIIEVAPINLGTTQSQETQAGTKTTNNR